MTPTGWRYFSKPSGTNNSMPMYLDAYARRMPPAALRLRSVSLECRPALAVIADYGQSPDCCLYVDPPYDPTIRAGGYREETTGDDHVALAEALHGCAASVVLSGYHSPLYADLYGEWDRVEMDAFTGQGDQATGQRTEVLWSNRPIGQARLDFGEAS